MKSNTENMDLHFIYAGHYYFWDVYECRLKSFIQKGMNKNKISKVMLTIIGLQRIRLMTKEKMVDCCNGKHEIWKKSVNDDLDSFFEDLRLGNEPNESGHIWTYFLPMLTEEELDLVEQEDLDLMNRWTFDGIPLGRYADVEEAEMLASESKSIFFCGNSYRKTYKIENKKEKVLSCCFLQ